MKKIAVLLLLLMALAAAEEISLQKAATLAVTEYPDLAVTPQSIPSQLSVLEDGSSYWIVEFDDIWVPVSREGELLKEEETIILNAYKTHYALKKIIDQRDRSDYITKQDQSLRILLGDVESREAYLNSYRPQLPTELQDEAQNLVTTVEGLKLSIQLSVNSLVDVTTMENDILYRAASYDDVENWRNDFTTALDALDSVVVKGNAYDDERVNFNLEAQSFLDSSNNTAEKEVVQAFVSGIAIPNIPGSLPGLQGTTDKFRSNMLQLQLTDEKIGTACQELYIKYGEFHSGETIIKFQQEAYVKVQALGNTVPLILADLERCLDDLSPREQSQFDELNQTYNKAAESYTQGTEYERALDETNAKEAYLNAISWADDAADLEQELIDVSCPAPTVTPTPGFDLVGFLTSGWGIALIVLVLALVGLYWWNSKKGEEEYYEDEYAGY